MAHRLGHVHTHTVDSAQVNACGIINKPIHILEELYKKIMRIEVIELDVPSKTNLYFAIVLFTFTSQRCVCVCSVKVETGPRQTVYK